MDVSSWNRRYATLLANVRNRTFAGIAAAALLLGVGVALAWVLRSAVVGAAFAVPPRDTLEFDGVSFGAGALVVAHLRLRDPAAGVLLEVPQVDVRGIGLGVFFGDERPIDLTLHSPRLTIDAGRGTVAEWRDALGAVGGWRRWRAGLGLHVREGEVDFGTPNGSVDVPPATVNDIAGDLTVTPHGALSYAVDAAAAGDQAFPLHGAAALDADGSAVHRWTAGALPLTLVSSLFGTGPDVVARAGTLRDVDVTFSDGATGAASDPQLRASAHLDGGDVALGVQAHEIRGLHGALTAVDDGLGSARLAGTIDGVPLEIAGEVHDLHHDHFRWLGDGSSDLRALAGMLAKVASQEHVRDVRLETVAPGIAFAQFSTTKPYGPLVVSAVSIDPKEPTVRFDTVLANDRVTSGGERTSAMAARTGAVLGINGDYYDIGGSWAPQGMVIRDGVLLRTPIERMALTLRRDGKVTFAEYHFHGTVHVRNADFPLTQLNNWPAGDVTLMTPEFGKIPPAAGVTLAELVPVAGAAGRFRIVRVGPAQVQAEPTYALAFGPLVHAALRVGDAVTVSYGVTPSAGDAVAGIGGGPLLLRNGTWYEDPHAPAPDERDVHWAVVALARMSDDSLMIFQVDGRHPERSIGITRPDFAELMREFGVQDAMALDSGGSSTIVSRAPGDAAVTVRNHPSDNDGERWVSNGLFVFSSAPAGTLLAPHPDAAASTPPPSGPK